MKNQLEISKCFYIENLGCAKNQVDAEVMIEQLEAASWIHVLSSDEADLIIINSCGFINPAKEESIESSLSFRQLYPDKKILLAGCLSQRYAKDLVNELREIDGFFGNSDLSKIVDVCEALFNNRRVVELPQSYTDLGRTRQHLGFRGSAYVKIAEGCNNCCSFCAIPLIRGDVKSRTVDAVLAEIRSLVRNDVKEINLVAQDLANFGIDKGKSELAELLQKISGLDGDFFIRLLYIHPDHFPFEILSIIKSDQRFIPYFDIPFQHASRSILQAMNRKGTAESYLELIQKIRLELPSSVIRSTFMLGFPSETQEDFLDLKKFLSEAQLDWAGFFVYSREEDTAAYSLIDDEEYSSGLALAEKRKNDVYELQTEISVQRLKRYIGKKYCVFIEEKIENEDLYLGRIYAQAPEIDGLTVIHAADLPLGTYVLCSIVDHTEIDLQAVPC